MQCPNCRFELAENAPICSRCGTRLTSISSPGLDYNIPQSEERKVLTILFTDVVDYTAISEKLDSEIMRQIMDGCFKILIEQVQKYGGTVDKLLGDGMMALFGAPLAFEDHAQRACRAALEMHQAIRQYSVKIQQQYGIEFRMRTGLNSGLVTMGSLGTGQKTDYAAIGNAVNLAARLEEYAQPDTILVSSETYTLARDYFQFQPLGSVPIRGKEQPASAYRLLASGKTASRFEAAIARGLTRFVGREIEMAVLNQAMADANTGKLQVVDITGEPGVGKSRLLREFRERQGDQKYTYLEGRCLQYGGAIPFKPLTDVIRFYFDISEGDSEIQIKNKMTDLTRDLDSGLVDYLPFLFDLLSLKFEDERFLRMENQYRRAKAFEGIRYLLTKESQNRPLVLAIEDLHWIDPASEDFLQYFLQETIDCRILLLLLHRPEYKLGITGRTIYHSVHLDQIPPEAGAELLVSLLSGRQPSEGLKELVLTRAGGNPLFIEEFVFTLIETGTVSLSKNACSLNRLAESVRLPDTIQGIIAARIDRLPGDIKNTLQMASVIGRDFHYQVLQDLLKIPEELKSHLESLQQLELITSQNTSPAECSFKHALIQEVAYNTLLQQRRRELHDKIGRTIEKLYPERLEEFSEILAHHFQQTGARAQAIHYFRLSGRKNYARFACREADANYQSAFDLLNSITRKTREEELAIIDVLIEWSYVWYYLGEFVKMNELLEKHLSLAESLGDKRRQSWLSGWLGLSLTSRGKPRDSQQRLLEALKLAEETGDQKSIAYMHNWLVYPYIEQAIFDKALECAEKAHHYSETSVADDYLFSKSLLGIGWYYAFHSDFKKAISCAEELLRFGQDHGNVRAMAMGYTVMLQSYSFSGDFQSVLNACQKLDKLNPDPLYKMGGIWGKAYAHFALGQMPEAIRGLNETIDFAYKYGLEWMGSLATACLSFSEMAKGNLSTGFRDLEQMKLFCYQEGRPIYYAMMLGFTGMVFTQIAIGGAPISLSMLLKNAGFILRQAPFAERKAVLNFKQAAEVAHQYGACSIEGQAYLGLGGLYLQKRRLKLASENLSRAIEIFTECDAQGYLKQAKELLEKL